ncbi:hypothetical protein [Paenibacillus albus]|uniref:Uncharacterized protein n=1 Tax=Paenibacillus albus TaxID=2495582 RepID=A0A3S9A175_9BACL|nr:hypothetical protein [Paenibacillus albus]AZN39425.1 hypothetical protein EJC50_06940 [Paenibacillus albus]
MLFVLMTIKSIKNTVDGAHLITLKEIIISTISVMFFALILLLFLLIKRAASKYKVNLNTKVYVSNLLTNEYEEMIIVKYITEKLKIENKDVRLMRIESPFLV